ncbi:MAG: hypothetical protein WBK91_09010 [Alphaproteobacteria bacterium]
MKKFLAGLVIAAFLLPNTTLASYSGFGTNEPYDSTGGSKITSEVIPPGTAEKTKLKKKCYKKKCAKVQKKKHKQVKKAKKSAKKAAVQSERTFKERTIETLGETLPPVQVPGAEQ